MHLGILLEKLRRNEDATLTLGALNDIVLYTEIARMCDAFDESPGEYVAAAASNFANLASDEDWMRLITAMERSDDAGTTVLTVVARWALARDRAGSQEPDWA